MYGQTDKQNIDGQTIQLLQISYICTLYPWITVQERGIKSLINLAKALTDIFRQFEWNQLTWIFKFLTVQKYM